MTRDIQLTCSPEEAADEEKLLNLLSRATGMGKKEITGFHLLKRSIDARKYPIKINLTARVFSGEEPHLPPLTPLHYRNIDDKSRVLIIGCGPAGMFAALRCIELGLKPVIIERGKDVQSRRRDLKAINRDHTVNPEDRKSVV